MNLRKFFILIYLPLLLLSCQKRNDEMDKHKYFDLEFTSHIALQPIPNSIHIKIDGDSGIIRFKRGATNDESISYLNRFKFFPFWNPKDSTNLIFRTKLTREDVEIIRNLILKEFDTLCEYKIEDLPDDICVLDGGNEQIFYRDKFKIQSFTESSSQKETKYFELFKNDFLELTMKYLPDSLKGVQYAPLF